VDRARPQPKTDTDAHGTLVDQSDFDTYSHLFANAEADQRAAEGVEFRLLPNPAGIANKSAAGRRAAGYPAARSAMVAHCQGLSSVDDVARKCSELGLERSKKSPLT